jgi:hypothetical protein
MAARSTVSLPVPIVDSVQVLAARSREIQGQAATAGLRRTDMGRIFLAAGAVVLLLTAGIHASALPLVYQWTAALPHSQHDAMYLFWMTASVDWTMAALLWAIAAWRQTGGWLAAAALPTFIPLFAGIGVMSIEPGFFGGQMLVGSALLAIVGLLLCWRRARRDQYRVRG